MQTETEKTNSEEPNEEAAIVEGSGGEESKHQSQSVEEILTEVLNTNKITEETQTEHISEYIIDPEDDTTVEQDEQVDSPIQEPDISSDQDDATTEPNDLNGVAEDTAAAPKTGEENGIDKIFKAIQKITHSHTDLSGEHTTGKIYEAIQKMTQSPADLPGQPAPAEKSTPGSTSEIAEDAQTEQILEETITHEDIAADEETPAEATDAEQIVEDSQAEQVPEETIESEDIAIEETPAEANDDSEITEGAQTEQVPEETIDPEDAAGEDQNEVEESLIQEPDISSDQDDTTARPNDTDSIAEVPAAAPEKGDGAGIDSTPDVTSGLPEICANEIMQNQVTWASPDDSLQQVIAKMQQTNAGYIMVGQNGTLEGIVSKSDITKAMSPYLLPIFAKWRRPLDDATLKIRIKWIMSRPVRTIKPEKSLTTIMEHMSQFRERCLPVMDEEDNVRGLVTAFDVFQKLLKSNSNTTETDRTAQALLESAKTTETT